MYPLKAWNGLTNRYLFWLLLSADFTRFVVLESGRVAMPKVNRETLNDISLPVPSISEQEMIADHLDRETGTIDATIAKAREQIERLREYRTALITAAVTGQIDLRDKG